MSENKIASSEQTGAGSAEAELGQSACLLAEIVARYGSLRPQTAPDAITLWERTDDEKHVEELAALGCHSCAATCLVWHNDWKISAIHEEPELPTLKNCLAEYPSLTSQAIPDSL